MIVRVSLCEVVHNETAGEMPTVGGLTAWIAVNAFGSLLAGRSAPLDNVMPSNLTRIDRDEHDALLRARTFAMEIGQGQNSNYPLIFRYFLEAINIDQIQSTKTCT